MRNGFSQVEGIFPEEVQHEDSVIIDVSKYGGESYPTDRSATRKRKVRKSEVRLDGAQRVFKSVERTGQVDDTSLFANATKQVHQQ